jgi:hypothetical protein
VTGTCFRRQEREKCVRSNDQCWNASGNFWSAELDRHVISVPEKRPILISTYPYGVCGCQLELWMQFACNAALIVAAALRRKPCILTCTRARRSEDPCYIALEMQECFLGTGIALTFPELVSTSEISSNDQIQKRRDCEKCLA